MPTSLRVHLPSQSRFPSLLSPWCTWPLLGLWLAARSCPRPAAARVPSRSFCKLGPPRPLLGSPTAFSFTNLETKSADFLCQALQVLRCFFARQVFPRPIRGAPPALCSSGPCPAAPHGVSEQEPMPESQIAELSFSSRFFTVTSIQIPRVRGNYTVRQAEPPCLVRLQYLREVAWHPGGCRLRQTNPLPFIL
jgi:hypothetical protein